MHKAKTLTKRYKSYHDFLS